MDQQHREGHKTGSGAPATAQEIALERKERLRRLALETVDLSKDPYLTRNNVGKIECKLCLTTHLDETSYLSHTQGRKHQTNLARRAAKEKLESGGVFPQLATRGGTTEPVESYIKTGRPGYRVVKMRDPETKENVLYFELMYPDIAIGKRPRHRFMSPWEQKIDYPDAAYQYIVFAAEPYESIAFKFPNLEVDRSEGKLQTLWNPERKTYHVQFYLKQREVKPLPSLSQRPRTFMQIGVGF